MASCTDLSKLALNNDDDSRSTSKVGVVPILSSKKFIEPFHRLKFRANLFRRKNFSSQLDLNSYHSDPRSSLAVEHIIPTHESHPTNKPPSNNVTLLKRSNSMICPQQHFQALLKSHDSTRLHQRKVKSKMSHIDEDDVLTVVQTEGESTPPILRDQAESIRTRRQSHNNTVYFSQRQSVCSSNDESFFDCPQAQQQIDFSQMKISICTMTGQSLQNLSISEEKAVQTNSFPLAKSESSTSLSSTSSISIPTDSLEKKCKNDQATATSVNKSTRERYQWPHLMEKLLGEQTCIYWVNYLGSTAIQISLNNPISMPTHAIQRLKHSTQYARILPIVGLSISSVGVQFLKHNKDRTAICFHPIKTIHCACQDRDLRYFAYVTREQRLLHPTSFEENSTEFHHYCHVFVVKSEAMSTEILLTLGQAFDIAYRLHQRHIHSKDHSKDSSSSEMGMNRIVNKVISSSTEERQVYI